MANVQIELDSLPPRDAEQVRRALVLLDLAATTDNPDTRFILQLSALHLVRAIPEYWYTTAEKIAIRQCKTGNEVAELKKRLASEFEEIFRTARRYELLSDLRRWDFHWEPLINPKSIGPNAIYGRGAPLVLTPGPNANSSACYIGGANRVVTTGSGRRIGRTNYYRIQNSRFVDFEKSEAVPLVLAIRQFIEDLPACIQKMLAKPEVVEYLSEDGS